MSDFPCDKMCEIFVDNADATVVINPEETYGDLH